VRTQLIITTITRVVSGFIVHEATSLPKNTLLQVVAVRWDKAWDRLKGTLTALGWVSLYSIPRPSHATPTHPSDHACW
jgi:hypothetical protein